MKLKDSRQAVEGALMKQIEKGKEEFLAGKVESAPHFGDALIELKTAFQSWNRHNIALLRAKFDDEDIHSEYNPKVYASSLDQYHRPDDLEQYEELKKSVQRKVAILNGILGRLDLYEERPMYGVSGGKIDHLHVRVIEVSGKSVKDGNFRAAIMDAFIALDNHVQIKANRGGLTGSNLMQAVFSPTKPLLRLSNDKEEQTGFMMLYTGAIKAIRNQFTHNVVNPANEQEAMEWLGFASALFRLADVATIERA